MIEDGPLPSNMMVRPLLLSGVLDHAAERFGWRPVVSQEGDGTLVRLTFAALSARARCLATALLQLGVRPGDRVATLGWTTHRHLELYYAIAGIGAVCHTLNPRYADAQLTAIARLAGNRLAFVEADLADRWATLAPHCPDLERTIIMAGEYEALLSAEPLPEWPQFDETSASSMCFTSGTTGPPKGVAYSHRSTVLYALGGLATGKNGMGPKRTALMCVPMFHVNGWSKPHQAMLTGTGMVLPGRRQDAASLHALVTSEGVTTGYGVPTIWSDYCEHAPPSPSTLNHVVLGGGSAPRGLVRQLMARGIQVETGYGITETTAGLALGRDGPDTVDAAESTILDLSRWYRPMFGIETKVMGGDGRPVPQGEPGELWVRGNIVAASYYGGIASEAFQDGWFRTGDVVRVDGAGRLSVVDRIRDLVKSGGEWISSLELESQASAHPSVMEAAVIGLPHPRWAERPLLLVRLQRGHSLDVAALREHLVATCPRWWLPDAILDHGPIPRATTGKIDKRALRQAYDGWHFKADGLRRADGTVVPA